MSIAAYLNPQRDFSAGELDDVAARRDDTDIQKAGARRMRDFELMLAGGFRRRPGMRNLFYGNQVNRVEPFTGDVFDIEFRANEFRARNSLGVLQSLVAGWTAQQLPFLRWALYENQLIVVMQTMRPKVITYDRTSGLWSMRDFQFESGLNGMLRQPFFRFAAKGVTMKPNSNAPNAVGNAQFSAPVLDAGQIGVEFKWVGRRMLMTAFADAQNGTFKNLEELPPSQRCVMQNVNGYRVGDSVTGATGGSEGQLVAINLSTPSLDIVITEKYAGFVTTEKIVSAEASAAVNGAPANLAPFATTIWDEAFMSDFRGWPGSVSVDRQRLIFCDFKQLPGAFIESAVGTIEDFEIEAGASAAFFEIVPQRERVLHVAGGADQFIFTVKTIYFIPISALNPLGPGTIEFRAIGTGGCSPVEPVATQSSLLFMSDDRKRVMALRQTGQQTQPYVLDHLSRYHSTLINNPVDMAISYGQSVDSNDTVHIVNADGSVVIGRYDPESDFVGFVKWATDGRITGATALSESVLYSVSRSFGVKTVNTIEILDNDKTLDGVITTDVIQGGPALIPFAGATMHRIVNGVYRGTAVIREDGTVAGPTGPGVTQFGFNYTPEFQPFVPNFDRGESNKQRLRRRKIKRYAITARKAGPFKVGNKDFAGYRIGDNLGLAPPLRDGTFTGATQGRDYDPTLVLKQPVPYSLQIIEVGMEVTS
jgi:hypothetical protein